MNKFKKTTILFSVLIYLFSDLAFSYLTDDNAGLENEPVILSEGTQKDIVSGSKLSLTCKGNAQLFWLFPDDKIYSQRAKTVNTKTNNTYGSGLEIENMKFNDTGLYQCCSTVNKIERCQKRYIFVNDHEHLFLPASEIVIVHRNTKTIIPCRTTFSNINVTLWKRNERVRKDQNVSYHPISGFTIENSSLYYSGFFWCKTKYENDIQELMFELDYEYESLQPPKINLSPIVDIPKGSNIEIKCTGEKPVIWIYPEIPSYFVAPGFNIIHYPSNELKQEETLKILNATYANSGPFLCCYEDYKCELNKTSSLAFLRVNDPDHLYVPEVETVITEELKCLPFVFQCIPSMPNVTVELLYQFYNSSYMFNAGKDFTYYPTVGFIPANFEILRRNSKKYFCKYNYENSSKYIPKNITVLNPKYSIQISISDEKPFEGEDVEIICEGCKFAFKTLTLTWRKRDQIFAISMPEDSKIKDIKFSDESTIYNFKKIWKFTSVNHQTEGEYRCDGVTQSDLKENQFKKLYIKDVEKPICLKTNMDGGNVTIVPGTGFEFTCIVHGEPAPEISWYKDGLIVNETNTLAVAFLKNNERLKIIRVSRIHFGTYRCQAQNLGGTIFREMTLISNSTIEGKSSLKKDKASSSSTIVLPFTILCVFLAIGSLVIIYLIIKNRLKSKSYFY